jgi:hypothetical protein
MEPLFMPKKVALITGVTGQDGSYLAKIIQQVPNFKGSLEFDNGKSDEARRKLLDASPPPCFKRILTTDLWNGVDSTYRCYSNQTI